MQDKYIHLELLDRDDNYSFAIGRMNKNEELGKYSTFESKDKKEMIKWLNKIIKKKCRRTSEYNLWFCFDLNHNGEIYTLKEIENNLSKEGVFTI